ncbi:glutamate receptor [Micractinium conductrix]|uniref:Glutamate receptor n=1 Tax=Micractinium conductrix TaxID=554055 RepID=A0A2P6VRD9_9CHLO|nr:glutamate receptor [Micractinium conductrix]|eukprot:PSC76640.1 glutamate receptor [Micractinium conductrix]
MCKNEETYDPADFSGHDVAVVRQAAAVLGLVEEVDWEFRCDSFSTMVKSLTNGSGPCSAVAAGVTITTERESQGIKFSYPYYSSSLSTLVQATTSSGTGWGFIRPFSWTLWLALLITLLVFPLLIFLIEFLSLRKRIHRGDVVPGVVESTWRSTLTVMLMDNFAVTSQGARIAVLTFCFLALLVTSTYTANLAAFVTVNTIRSNIASVTDLRGRAVGTSPIYIERLQKYGIQGIPYPFNQGSDYLVWRDLVSSGQLAAIVRDTPALQWLANTDPVCSTVVLPQSIEPFQYGIAFHTNTSEAVVDAWSSAILRLQEGGSLEELKDSWITPQSGCQMVASVNRGAEPVEFADLYGLWIILAAGLGTGALVMFAQRFMRRHRKHRAMALGTALSLPASLPDYDRPPPNLMTGVMAMEHRKQARRKAYGRSISGRSARGKGGRSSDGGAGKNGAATPLAGTWDLESGNGSGSPKHCGATEDAAPQVAGTPGSETSAGAASAGGPQSQSQQSPPPTARSDYEMRPTALQAADSVFASGTWLSEMKSGSRWHTG